MKAFRTPIAAAALILVLARTGVSEDPPPVKPATAAQRAARVYGEWRIQIRPDKGAEYAQLIETAGLPLFTEAGGRMVGWWTTVVGDLYEHVTIWEYDDMAAFEQAGAMLGKSERFAKFVARRDPLLAGESNRFLRLPSFATDPLLPVPSRYVVHEIHRVPLERQEAYLRYMQATGLELLKRNGFQPVGPWLVNVGNWNEVTYLFRFESLRDRERLIAAFGNSADAKAYGKMLNEFTTEITTRILAPAPFAHKPPPKP